MNSSQNISQKNLTRSSIVWFSLAFILTIIPQLFIFLPIWVAVIFIVCFAWRIQIFRMKLGYPNGVVKFVIIAAIIGTLYLTKGNFLNTEGCTILFMAVYGLKFVESKTLRDGYILGCIGFIALASMYLFDTSAYIFAFSLLVFITLITAMIGLQQMGYGIYSNKSLLLNGLKIMVISLPLMLILFIVFPRFPSMLPSIPKGKSEPQAQTGVSNRMEPGSIAELANSENHILWAEFAQNIPQAKELYWRSLTLDQFDGRAWTQSDYSQTLSQPQYKIRSNGNEQQYDVIFDPTHQRYLATLDLSLIDHSNESRAHRVLPFGDFRYEYNRPVDERIQYSATYVPNASLLTSINPRTGEYNLGQFLQTTNNNPQTTELVESIVKNSNSNEEVVQAILSNFKQNGYQYTMEPGLLNNANSIDEFMFDSKVGFCEHYASATAFMLRKANIPSRVVVGYLGGDIDPKKKLVEVRGKDAHAWVEYWDDQKGWTRIDPTSAVAPNRIDLGVDDLINQLTGNKKPSMWNDLKLSMTKFQDMIDYRWAKIVLGYKSQAQQSLLQDLFKIDFISVFTLVKISIGLIISFIFVQIIIFLKPWRYFYFNVHKEYFRVIELANQRYHLDLPVSTAPTELLDRLSRYLSEEDKSKFSTMVNMLVAHYYAPKTTQIHLSQLKHSLFAVQSMLKKRVNKSKRH